MDVPKVGFMGRKAPTYPFVSSGVETRQRGANVSRLRSTRTGGWWLARPTGALPSCRAADRQEAFLAHVAQRRRGQAVQRGQFLGDRLAQRGGGGGGVAMRAAHRLGHDAVDHALRQQRSEERRVGKERRTGWWAWQ